MTEIAKIEDSATESGLEAVSGISQTLAPLQRHAGIEIDLVEVEHLASRGMTQALIADGLGISESTVERWLREDRNGFKAAYKRGLHRYRCRILDTIHDSMSAKNPIPAMFAAKQPHTLGWQDVQRRELSGEVKLVVEERVLHEGKISQGDKDKAEDV